METARLRLRPPCPGDAPAIAAAMTPAISQWLGRWPVPFTLEMAQARIAEALDATAQRRALVYVVEHRCRLAGWIGGGRVSGTHHGSFDFWLGEPHHGQALMQEAAPVFVAAIQGHLALHSIEAACQPENYGSAKVLAACGLRRIGSRIEPTPARNRNELVNVWERIWITRQPGSPTH